MSVSALTSASALIGHTAVSSDGQTGGVIAAIRVVDGGIVGVPR